MREVTQPVDGRADLHPDLFDAKSWDSSAPGAALGRDCPHATLHVTSGTSVCPKWT